MSLETKKDTIQKLLTKNGYSEAWIEWTTRAIESEEKADEIIAIIEQSGSGPSLAVYDASGSPPIVPRRAELESSQTISIDARGSRFHQAERKIKFARCGDCGDRYEITDDPTENHHRAMRHKDACRKHGAIYSPEQHEQLVKEFGEQPHIVAMRARLQAGLPALPPEGSLHEQKRISAPDPSKIYEPTWPDGSPVRGAHGPLTFTNTRNPAQPAKWWQFWRWFE